MPKYKLTYFDVRGRAEMTRMAFAAGGIEFEDCRVKREEWAALKPTTPQGVMPLLEVDGKDGKVLLYQSYAIARFVARECNLYGGDNLEAAKIDVVLDTLQDLNNTALKIGPWFMEQDPAKQNKSPHFLDIDITVVSVKYLGLNPELLEKLKRICDVMPSSVAEKKAALRAADCAPKFLGFIEKAIERFGSSGFAASKSLSIADLALYCTLDFWKLTDLLDGCPKIVGARRKVEENKRLAKYLKERKDSRF